MGHPPAQAGARSHAGRSRRDLPHEPGRLRARGGPGLQQEACPGHRRRSALDLHRGPATGADLDKCRDPKTGELATWAEAILALAETYAEVSPSGTGLRLIWRGKVEQTVKSDPMHVEVYR